MRKISLRTFKLNLWVFGDVKSEGMTIYRAIITDKMVLLVIEDRHLKVVNYHHPENGI